MKLKNTAHGALTVLLLASELPSMVQAAAPNSCGFVTTAAWSGLLSKPVTGGTMSTVNDPSSDASSCLYRAGPMLITVQVSQLATPAAAQAAYAEQLDNSRSRDDRDSQHTTVETGVGEGAFSSAFADGSEVEFTAVKGSRMIAFGLVGAGAAGVPHDRLRALMLAALSH